MVASPKSHFTAQNVAFVELGELMLFDIVTNAVCAYPLACMQTTNVSKTNTRTIVLYVEKICSPHVSLRRIFLVAMRYMLTVFESWLVLITDARFVKKLLFHRNQWQLHGTQERGI